MITVDGSSAFGMALIYVIITEILAWIVRLFRGKRTPWAIGAFWPRVIGGTCFILSVGGFYVFGAAQWQQTHFLGLWSMPLGLACTIGGLALGAWTEVTCSALSSFWKW